MYNLNVKKNWGCRVNLLNPYLIHSRTQGTYKMFQVRKCTSLGKQKKVHFECRGTNMSIKGWDGAVYHHEAFPLFFYQSPVNIWELERPAAGVLREGNCPILV